MRSLRCQTPKSPSRLSTRRAALSAAFAALLLATAGQPVRAQSLLWDADANGANGATDGGGTWNTSLLNWYNGTATDVVWPNNTTTAAFGAGTVGAYTVNVGTVTAGGLTFNQDGYTLSGGTITLSPANATTGFVVTTNGGTSSITNTVLTGGTGTVFRKTGAGTLVISNTTSNLGGSSAATPDMGVIMGGTFSAATSAFDSVLQVPAANFFGSAPTNLTNVITLDAGTLRFTQNNTAADNNLLAATRGVVVSAAGGAITDAGNTSNNASINAPITFNAGTTNTNLYLAVVNASATTNFTATNVISGTGNVVWNGGGAAGTAILRAANTYTGNTSLNGGVVQLVAAETAGTSGPLGKSGTINFNGGTLQYSSTNVFDYSPRFSQAANQAYRIDTNGQNVNYNSLTALTSVGGTFTKLGTGTLILTGTNTYTGTTTVSGGTLQISNNGTSATIGSGNIVDNATLAFARANAYTVGNTISGSGNLTQIGTGGTLTLTGLNTYNGGTTVTNTGTLLANNATINNTGSATGAGAVTIGNAAGSSTGTLGGTGSVLGAVTVNPGSTITGGTNGAVGALTLGSSLSLTGSTFAVDISGATADRLTIAGVLTLSSATITFTGTPTAASYVLATYASEMGTFAGTAPSGYTLQYNANGTELDLVAVPEPSTWVSCTFLLAVVGWRVRRHRSGASV